MALRLSTNLRPVAIAALLCLAACASVQASGPDDDDVSCCSYPAGLAVSADGQRIAAAEYGGYIITTRNGKAPYEQNASLARWSSIAGSSDGARLAAAVVGGNIYTSSDSGASWTKCASVQKWICIASSSDGTKLAAAAADGYIYTSANAGSSWRRRATAQKWTSIASSADGARLAATVSGGPIYTSADAGATWTARATSRSWKSIASSSDGERLVAVVTGGFIYTSTDAGATWLQRATPDDWDLVASSGQGLNLAAVDEDGDIYSSTDGGETWSLMQTEDTQHQWSAIAFQPDGTRLLLASVEGDTLVTMFFSGDTVASGDRSDLYDDYLLFSSDPTGAHALKVLEDTYKDNPELLKSLSKALWEAKLRYDAGAAKPADAISDIAEGADINSADPKSGMTPLMSAAADNHDPAMIAALLKSGAKLDTCDPAGMTALMFAAKGNSNPDVLRALLKAGANARPRSREGKTAFDYAAANGKFAGTDVLAALKKAAGQ